jgi:thiamine-monophosphate kinase
MDHIKATLTEVGEYGLHALLEGLLNKSDRAIGDDCAVVPLHGGAEVLINIDRLPLHTTPSNRARLLVAQTMSDIISMGGTPAAMLVGLSLPRDFLVADFEDLHVNIAAECSRYGARLIGGDTKEGPEFHLTGVGIGFSSTVPLVRRVGAEPGMAVVVTSAKDKRWGLRWARALVKALDITLDAALSQALEEANTSIFLPVEETMWLMSNAHPAAGLDLSDGVAGAFSILSRVNAAGFEVWEEALDGLVDPSVASVAAELGLRKSAFALSPGYMWENLYCVDEDLWNSSGGPQQPGLQQIGRVTAAAGSVSVTFADGASSEVHLLTGEKFMQHPWEAEPQAWVSKMRASGFGATL